MSVGNANLAHEGSWGLDCRYTPFPNSSISA